jgi:hypothetical protein
VRFFVRRFTLYKETVQYQPALSSNVATAPKPEGVQWFAGTLHNNGLGAAY